MTDKEFKRLSRAQLIDIIYQYQLQVDKLTEQNQALEREVEDKRIRLQNAGNIADAALEINECFRSAQNAAEQYLNEIKALRQEAEEERQLILARARAEAEAIVADSKKLQVIYDFSIEKVLKETEQSHSDNGDAYETKK